MTNILKPIFLLAICLIFDNYIKAQGCSDAGFCTIGSHQPENNDANSAKIPKSEFDIQYTFARHSHNERFNVPQINYRLFNKKGSYFEVRLPLNIAKDRSTGISKSGIGDVTATYNGILPLNKHHLFSYTTGLRVSFSHSDATNTPTFGSYPMFLQSGLGTTDFIGVVNYRLFKYLSVGTGVQIPFLQYNKNQLVVPTAFSDPFSRQLIAYNFHRQPDALLRLDGNFSIKKFSITGGLVTIFHLKNDYYESYKYISGADLGRYELLNSQGTTINMDINFRYPLSKKIDIGLLYAAPLKTRSNIPDGLARSLVITPKITMAF